MGDVYNFVFHVMSSPLVLGSYEADSKRPQRQTAVKPLKSVLLPRLVGLSPPALRQAQKYKNPSSLAASTPESQFSPLSAFGCNLRSNFPATLFRFPLRTPEQASASRLSRQAHGVPDMRALLQAFAKESAGMLLFLKNVERMSVFEWSPGQSEPKQVNERLFVRQPIVPIE